MNATWSHIVSSSARLCDEITSVRPSRFVRRSSRSSWGVARVEAARRLVEEHQLGAAEQRLGHGQATQHAVREGAGAHPGAVGEPDRLEHPRGVVRRLLGADALEAREVDEVGAAGGLRRRASRPAAWR